MGSVVKVVGSSIVSIDGVQVEDAGRVLDIAHSTNIKIGSVSARAVRDSAILVHDDVADLRSIIDDLAHFSRDASEKFMARLDAFIADRGYITQDDAQRILHEARIEIGMCEPKP